MVNKMPINENEMIEKIDLAFRKLSEYLNRYKVVSSPELKTIIAIVIDKAKITEDEKHKFCESFGYSSLEDAFFESITEMPISINSPQLQETHMWKGIQFHHSHTYQPIGKDYDDAIYRLRDFAKFYSPEEIVREFFKKAGYTVKETEASKFLVEKAPFSIVVYLMDSINDLEEFIKEFKEEEIETVVLIPTGQTITPYMKFYREYSETVLSKNLKVWVINIFNGTINPFIGYPKDQEIIKQFENPNLGRIVARTWKK